MAADLRVLVLPGHIQDRDGAKQLLAAFFAKTPRRGVTHTARDNDAKRAREVCAGSWGRLSIVGPAP